MTQAHAAVDLEAVVKVLVSFGSDAATVRSQLEAARDDGALLDEIAALAVESEAGAVLSPDLPMQELAFELTDLLRQAGAEARLGSTTTGPALVLGGAPDQVLDLSSLQEPPPRTLAAALSARVAATHCFLVATTYDAGDSLPLLVLDRSGFEALLEATAGGVRSVLEPLALAGETAPLSLVPASSLVPVDFRARYLSRLPPEPPTAGVSRAFARIERHDPRVAWPLGNKRPPGDDFYELTVAIVAEGLGACLSRRDPIALGNLLYQFALATLVGAQWDVLAARQNPGMSAQGVLGFGQLSWAWFILYALGKDDDAARVAALLDDEWVRGQERGTVALRQRAYFDLGAYLRTGARGVALLRLRELLPLCARAGWTDRPTVDAALATISETIGDQIAHQPLCHFWPAPLYALSRHAAATDLLPEDNPFLSHRASGDELDLHDPLVVRLRAQLARFDTIDSAKLPPLLDPLPVVVDVRVTEVDEKVAHGRTLLCERDDVEHHVVGAHGGKPLKAGEIWLFEVQGARAARGHARYDDLGEVAYNISLPTGVWLAKVEG